MAEVIQSQLKGIGLKAEIQVMEYGAYIQEISNKQHQMFIGGRGMQLVMATITSTIYSILLHKVRLATISTILIRLSIN